MGKDHLYRSLPTSIYIYQYHVYYQNLKTQISIHINKSNTSIRAPNDRGKSEYLCCTEMTCGMIHIKTNGKNISRNHSELLHHSASLFFLSRSQLLGKVGASTQRLQFQPAAIKSCFCHWKFADLDVCHTGAYFRWCDSGVPVAIPH